MNIAFYSHYFVPEIGAPSARVYDMAMNWIGMGDQVEVVTCFPNHPTGRLHDGYRSSRHALQELDGLRVHRQWTYITPNKGLFKKTLGHVSFVPSAALTSSRQLQAPNVIIGTSPTLFAAQAAAFAARRYRVPFVMEVRDLWPGIFVDLGVLKNRVLIGLLERWEMSLYRQARRVVTVTERFRENLIERGIAASKVVTITNGADTKFWSQSQAGDDLRKQMHLEGKLVALYIGAHGISQALRAILKAAERLRSRSDIVFLFVGEGAEKEALVAFAGERGLKNVRFLDPVGKEEVRNFYALADVGLVPLRDIAGFDAFIPSKMFEFLAMNRPVLGSVRGEAAEILERSGAAIVVKPEDDEAIAEGIIALADNAGRRVAMGKAGRCFVCEHYSRTTLAQRYRQVLEEAVAEHG
jgi:glycosyltransferase involved in cell wall biosynthesis